MLKWAQFAYNGTFNLGDEIQTIAAMQYTPPANYQIDRDDISSFLPPENEQVALIANGWFGHQPESLIPAPNVVPLFISMHFSEARGFGSSGLSGVDALRQPEVVSYLKRWAPIGARDLFTYNNLQSLGIESYFSGCLTLTLDRAVQDKGEYVLCVDIPDEAISFIRRQTNRQIIIETNVDVREGDRKFRFQKAERLLRLSQAAHSVVTSRLHCALPCLAYNVPVFVIDMAPDGYRFSGLSNFYRHSNLEDFLQSRTGFSVENPTPNRTEYLVYRESIKETVRAFCRDPLAYAESRRELSPTQGRGTYLSLLRTKFSETEYIKNLLELSKNSNIYLEEQRSQLEGRLALAEDNLSEVIREINALKDSQAKENLQMESINKSLTDQLVMARRRPHLELIRLLQFRVLRFLTKISSPFTKATAQRLARSAAKRDPRRREN